LSDVGYLDDRYSSIVWAAWPRWIALQNADISRVLGLAGVRKHLAKSAASGIDLARGHAPRCASRQGKLRSIERDYEELKSELGLARFEGRSLGDSIITPPCASPPAVSRHPSSCRKNIWKQWRDFTSC
jgi:hypothetical protein